MKKGLISFTLFISASFVNAQVANDADGNFDSTTYVETSNNTSSTNNNNTTINATNTNTNNNIVSGGTNNTNFNTNFNSNNTVSINTNTNTNTNVNTSTNTNVNTSTNTNVNTSTNTNVNTSTVDTTNSTVTDNTNTNYSENISQSVTSNINENRSVSESTQTQNINQKIDSPPPSAIAPSIGSSYSQDLCTTGVSGAVQTQILGFSGGKSIKDENCERIKLSKTLYDMGMRVAAVSLMCQDERVWTAMKMAGTPCPYEGLIGIEAGEAWEENLVDIPGIKEKDVERGRVTESPNRPR